MIVFPSWLIYSEQLGVDIKWNTEQSSNMQSGALKPVSSFQKWK